MKKMIRNAMVLAALTAGLSLPTRAASGPGLVDFGKFTPPKSGGEFVEVHLGSNLIAMAARLAEKEEPEIAKVLHGLQLVRLNVIGLDEENGTEIRERVESIRGRLDEEGWERVVTVKQKKDDVSIHVKLRGEEVVEGVVVTVLEEGGKAVLVNVVGDIRPEQLALVGERFNFEPLKKLNGAFKKS